MEKTCYFSCALVVFVSLSTLPVAAMVIGAPLRELEDQPFFSPALIKPAFEKTFDLVCEMVVHNQDQSEIVTMLANQETKNVIDVLVDRLTEKINQFYDNLFPKTLRVSFAFSKNDFLFP